jgi:hypothetical protein
MTLFIERTYHDKVTTSDIVLRDGARAIYQCKGLELPWRNNERKQSCIPEGRYMITRRTSPKYGEHFHVLNVTNRSFILIHQGNFTREIEGCILPGTSHQDIDRDGIIDVTNSRVAMTYLLKHITSDCMAVFYKKGTDPAKHVFK